LIEKVSIDEAYLGLEEKRLCKDFKKDDPYEAAKILAQKIKDEIFKKEKLTCSCGIGPNKLIAKVACHHQKPNGLTVVKPNEVDEFLKNKPVLSLPGIGPKTEKVLSDFSVKIFRQEKDKIGGGEAKEFLLIFQPNQLVLLNSPIHYHTNQKSLLNWKLSL